ncbi:acyltransferase [Streptococcus suis]|uniref:acyltransferase n=1 Tax=Streptococcus suis TaxID=1307 RepID=UPI00209AA123|nr:acyltransferase [Streptococcus suis]MCO8212902.1 acyltransferase [Streptococcus suis]HEM3438052.1 acyltransferase [Streptococcus suis]
MYLLMRLFIYLLPSGVIRTKWIEKFNIFGQTGKNFYFCPRKIPADPKLIKFHDNVAVATDVMFINHDVSQKVFNNYKAEKLPKFYGCIEIGNNVFIGARATILPNVSICDNVFIAAGALVSSSITESGIYGGVPARKIGDMDELYETRLNSYKQFVEQKEGKELHEAMWSLFESKK